MDQQNMNKPVVTENIEPAPPAYTSSASQGTPADQPFQQQQQPRAAENVQNSNSHFEPTKPEPVRMEYRPQADPNADHRPAQSAMVTPLFRLADQPAQVDCPYCKRVTLTRVEQHSSGMTIAAGVLLGLVCICLACVPCLMHACADRDHFCNNCGKQLTHQPHDSQVQVLAGQPGQQDGAVPSQYAAAQNQTGKPVA